jgi:hypothetical protein
MTSGTKLGPYEIIVPIAAGDMGEVYKARHAPRSHRGDQLKRFRHLTGREARVTALHSSHASRRLPSPTKMSG